jgi:hypothetical protein
MTPRRDSKGPKKQPDYGNRTEWKKNSPGPRPSDFTVGDALEYEVARLQIFMGYFVRRGCPIYTVAALDRATDLDVLGIKYVQPFRREVIITECKGGDSQPLDRIFWLSGVRQYVSANQAFLVRKGTKWNIKDFAKESGLQVIDFRRLQEIQASLQIVDSEWPGVSDRQFYEAELQRWNDTLHADARFWELVLTLSSEIRFDDPFVGVNYLIPQLRMLTRVHPQQPANSFHRFLFAESLTHVALFLMRIAENSFDLTDADRQGFILKGLKYGNLDPRYAERVLTSAYNLAKQAVFHYTKRDVPIEKSLFSMPEPAGGNAIASFIGELIRAYPASLEFPPVLDLVLSESVVKSRSPSTWLNRIFPRQNIRTTMQLVQRFLEMVSSLDACPRYILSALPTPETKPPVEAAAPIVVGATPHPDKATEQSQLFGASNATSEPTDGESASKPSRPEPR